MLPSNGRQGDIPYFIKYHLQMNCKHNWLINLQAHIQPSHTYSIVRETYTSFWCALFCFDYVIYCNESIWSIYTYSPGWLHWHWGNRMIAPVPVKSPWGMCVKPTSLNHNKTPQRTNHVHISWDVLQQDWTHACTGRGSGTALTNIVTPNPY